MITTSAIGQALDLVDLVAALWALGEPEPSLAHPPLAPLVDALRQHGGEPGIRLFTNLRQGLTRDQLIKGVVGAAVGRGVGIWAPPLYRALVSLGQRLDPPLADQLASYRKEAHRLVEPIFGQLEPVTEMAELIGEPLPISFELHPSGLLPLPQDGRHGVTLVQPDGHWQILLCFGLPLVPGPVAAGITPAWFQRGTWHYLIKCYLARLGPQAVPEAEQHSFQHHLAMGLRYGLWRLAGRPGPPFLRLAEGQGFRMIHWFAEKMDAYLRERRQPLAQTIEGWTKAYVEELPTLKVLAAAPPPPVPQVIACALMPLWAKGVQVVVPDHWLLTEGQRTRLEKSWHPFGLHLCPWSAWAGNGPAVLYGDPAERPRLAALLGGIPGPVPPAGVLVSLVPEGWHLFICGADETALSQVTPYQLLQFGAAQVTLLGGQVVAEVRGAELFDEIIAEFR